MRHCISEYLQKGARGSSIPRHLRLHWCNKCYMRYIHLISHPASPSDSRSVKRELITDTAQIQITFLACTAWSLINSNMSPLTAPAKQNSSNLKVAPTVKPLISQKPKNLFLDIGRNLHLTARNVASKLSLSDSELCSDQHWLSFWGTAEIAVAGMWLVCVFSF